MKIKSLAEMKRALAIPGVVMHVVDHWQAQLVGTTRSVKQDRANGKPGLQGNGYWFDGLSACGEVRTMWSEFPKASELLFNQDATVTFHPTSPRSWTLRFDVPSQIDSRHNLDGVEAS